MQRLSELGRYNRTMTHGMTKRAICCQVQLVRVTIKKKRGGAITILEPTATPKLSVSLSLTDTVTAVTCSELHHRLLVDLVIEERRTHLQHCQR
jgi:hypothetical protein